MQARNSLKRRVIVAAGSSGGHIFPALSFIEALKEMDNQAEVLLVLPKANIAGNIGFGCRVKLLPVYALSLKPTLRNAVNFLKFLGACLESLFTVVKFNPDLAVGFGTSVSVPVIISSWLFRARTLIHEQNVVPGKANKFLANFSDKIAVSFKDSARYLTNKERKIVLTGNPLRSSLKNTGRAQARDYMGLDRDKFTILAMGGSQGARKINKTFLEFVSSSANNSSFQVIHLSGASDFDYLEKKYKECGINFKLFKFFDEMQYAYSASDVVLSRAGASAINEISFFKIPAVLVPYPFANAHQSSNAKVLGEHGAAIVIEENVLDARSLKECLESLMNDRQKLISMSRALEGMFKPNAAKKIAEEAIN